MKVFKFGGASVKDAAAIRNVSYILSLFKGEKLAVVISAMGKTTNALELVVKARCEQDEKTYLELLKEREDFHKTILQDLFPEDHFQIFEDITTIFEDLRKLFRKPLSDNYNFEYDRIVSIGEVLSTRIVAAFLREEGHDADWLDARKVIRTDHTYREGNVLWDKTEENVRRILVPALEKHHIQVTQGFIGHTAEGMTTTLGREGSDYTAGILAYCLNAESVTIWKDVPGMLNADPKWFDNTIKLDRISFKEAIELSYYGASVIHPKTVKPLQNRNIPLYVRSFIDPKAEGTVIQQETAHDSMVPSFIFKMDQLLIGITTRDFSFIVEEHLSDIFEKLARLQVKINVMQNSALSFSILVDQSKTNIEAFKELFETSYKLHFDENLELVTIRHYDRETIERVTGNKEIILEQRSLETARIILRDGHQNTTNKR